MPVEHIRQLRRIPSFADRKGPGRRLAQASRRPLAYRSWAESQSAAPATLSLSLPRRPLPLRPVQDEIALENHPCVAQINWQRSLRRALMAVAALMAIAVGAGDIVRTSNDDTATSVTVPALTLGADTELAAGTDEDMAARIGAPAEVWRAITHATQEVGVDPAYLVAVAARESSFDPTVKALGTTATGLYQFTEDTWLRAVKTFGPRHGLGNLARQIDIDEDGGFVAHAGTRADLLRLRNDPKLAALMAAELARDNKTRLEHLLGREVSPAETYLAHFLGVGQAARIIDAAHSRPYVAAARILPTAARSNPAVFGPAGHATTAAAMVGKIEAYFDREVPRSARI